MFPIFSFWLSLLFALNFAQNTITSTLGNDTDYLALLKFKESISIDKYGILTSWNTSTHYCNWHGITCNPMQQRVVELDLEGYNLHGSIPPHVGNLSFLITLNLANNSFFGKIPYELGRLLRLEKLFLTNNSMTGEIPTNLASCSNLVVLGLYGNHLIGKIPIGISSLSKLKILWISNNNLTGRIPPFIGNLSSLIGLAIGMNHFEGDIPQEMCSLKNLTLMEVFDNKLYSPFPSCLYNMSSLTVIFAGYNDFNGTLPPNMFNTLSNLQNFAIGGNHLTGTIPISIANASFLQELDLSRNNLVGQVPSLGKSHDLFRLNLGLNHLGYNSTKDLVFLKSLTNCSKLKVISISYNNFGGNLPNFVGNLSTQLSKLFVGGNQISGKIPAELGNLIGLILLSMDFNRIEGIIPATFGKLDKMQLLGLTGNKLSGKVPPFIGNLSQLYHLQIGDNMFKGSIPSSIGNCKMLQYLDLSQNNLTGTIPLEVFSLPSLSNLLNLSKNSLSGSLPGEVGKLTNINMLDVSENHLYGDIPRTIGECIVLEYLYLQGNSFNGTMPSSLASLKGLRYLDLSRNRLYGPIPNVLQNISVLEHLNISFNKLEGEVPKEGVFGNVSRLVVTGNNELCGGISELHLQPCPAKNMKPTKHHTPKLIVVIVASIFLIVTVFLTIYQTRKRNKKEYSDPATIDQLARVSYQELHQGTDGFSSRNLVGLGSFGSVYKGYLATEDEVVAIKVLDLQKKGAHKSFIVECNALKNLRHRNLVKILTCCSSTDYKGQEFKALVFEYMNNGSLEQWLHPSITNVGNKRILNLDQRLNIIVDIASALHYLHHEYEQSVIHCDIKPSNILLDDDMVARVTDFGIARFVSDIVDTSHQETSTIGIEGTIGYSPPEYGMGSEISTYGDMYSFGVLMLEMLTGKRPTYKMFEDGQNLHMFVENSFPDNLIHILDSHLVPKNEAKIEDGITGGNFTPIVEKCLVSLFKIGLACSVESPKERMNIVDVTRELSIIKKVFTLVK